MNKIPDPYLKDIVKSIVLIERYLENTPRKKSFISDKKLKDALVRRIEIIGEATKRLEKDFKDMFPTLEKDGGDSGYFNTSLR
jgi:uncharacterized protein with HEPN domain